MPRVLIAVSLAAFVAGCAFNHVVDVPTPPTHVTASGVSFQDLVAGSGVPAVHGSLVKVNYVGSVQGGAQFDSTYERGIPVSFTIGKGETIAGLEEGVIGMRKGGKRRITIPPELAYGDKGVEGLIAPNSTLAIEVELLEVAGP
jgi:peptidylprolyl isomerase